MKNLLVLFSVAVTCCVAAPVQQQQQKWTAYIFPQGTTSPGLITIPLPSITLPTLPTINTQTKPTIANIPTVSVAVGDAKPVISLIIPSTNLRAAPFPGLVPVPIPVVKSARVAPSPVPAPALVVKSIPAAVPTPVVQTVAVAPVPVVVAAAPEPLAAPEPPMPSLSVPFEGGQFHSQDEANQYTFGHWGGPNTRVEVKDSLDRVSGSFAYINPLGDVHVRKYAAGPGMGFKVAASDLPEDTPAVAQVKATLAQVHAEAKARSSTSH